jgi:methionine-rich copper-binding protein CopC
MRRPTLSLLLLLLATGETAAHAFLDHAEPRVGNKVASPPREVTLWFTQKLEPAFSSVTVTNAAGQRVDSGRARQRQSDVGAAARWRHGHLSRELARAFGGHSHHRGQFHLPGRAVSPKGRAG